MNATQLRFKICPKCKAKDRTDFHSCRHCSTRYDANVTNSSLVYPPGFGPQLHYAGVGKRWVAMMIDAVLTAIPLFVAVFSGFKLHHDLLVSIGYPVSVWLYAAGLQSSAAQATLGQLMMGLRVSNLQGDQISFWRATGRYFATCLSSFLLIGYVIAFFTKRKQTLHDLISGTVVTE